MNADVVVDVGNTRIKWGRCDAYGVSDIAFTSSDTAEWSALLKFRSMPDAKFVIAGTRPAIRDDLARWLRGNGFRVRTLCGHRDLPIRVDVEFPDKVGLDRLLNGVAVSRMKKADTRAVIIDAGTAVTVDLLGADGSFQGGAIFPGLRLMAKALHDYTALLPVVEVDVIVAPPGTSTEKAIACGIVHAVVGGIEKLIHHYQAAGPVELFLTGGDGPLLTGALPKECWHRPAMTLQGIRLTGLALDEDCADD